MIEFPKIPLPSLVSGLYLHPSVLKGDVKYNHALVPAGMPAMPLNSVIREFVYCPLDMGVMVDGNGKVWMVRFTNDEAP